MEIKPIKPSENEKEWLKFYEEVAFLREQMFSMMGIPPQYCKPFPDEKPIKKPKWYVRIYYKILYLFIKKK